MDRGIKVPPGQTQMILGGELLYDPGRPISDTELLCRIKRALRNVGWVPQDRTVPTPPPPLPRVPPQKAQPGQTVPGPIPPQAPIIPRS